MSINKSNNQTTRRMFINTSIFSLMFFSLVNKVMGKKTEVNRNTEGAIRPFEEMRPDEIQGAIKMNPYAFVPVSPMIEWHSYHLPMGTDALISASICRIMAEKVGGVWFRPLSFGLDSWRNDEQKEMWGFKPEEEVFGMNFPDVPLKSEYCQVDEMKKTVENRVNALKSIGLKHIFLLNHHGGEGQIPLVEQLGETLTDEAVKVHGLKTYQFNDLTEEEGWYDVGGHAGYSETTWLMAYRPELVDLSQQKSGKLSVRATGILHNKPTIEEKWNPRNVSFAVANKLRQRVTENFKAFIEGID